MTTTIARPAGSMQPPVSMHVGYRWQLDGACVGMVSGECDPWCPDEDLPAAQRRELVEFAKAICADCPVRAVCLSDALCRAEPHTVRGGLDEAERRAHAGAQGRERAPRHGTRGGYTGGCHCGACREANTRYMAEWRNRRPVTPHATLDVTAIEGVTT